MSIVSNAFYRQSAVVFVLLTNIFCHMVYEEDSYCDTKRGFGILKVNVCSGSCVFRVTYED